MFIWVVYACAVVYGTAAPKDTDKCVIDITPYKSEEACTKAAQDKMNKEGPNHLVYFCHRIDAA